MGRCNGVPLGGLPSGRQNSNGESGSHVGTGTIPHKQPCIFRSGYWLGYWVNNLTARGEEPSIPRTDNNKAMGISGGTNENLARDPPREHNIPGPRYMDQLWDDRKPGKEFKYYPWQQLPP